MADDPDDDNDGYDRDAQIFGYHRQRHLALLPAYPLIRFLPIQVFRSHRFTRAALRYSALVKQTAATREFSRAAVHSFALHRVFEPIYS